MAPTFQHMVIKRRDQAIDVVVLDVERFDQKSGRFFSERAFRVDRIFSTPFQMRVSDRVELVYVEDRR
ncbi:hypothetical protein D3C80_913620 [compost metagenome]